MGRWKRWFKVTLSVAVVMAVVWMSLLQAVDVRQGVVVREDAVVTGGDVAAHKDVKEGVVVAGGDVARRHDAIELLDLAASLKEDVVVGEDAVEAGGDDARRHDAIELLDLTASLKEDVVVGEDAVEADGDVARRHDAIELLDLAASLKEDVVVVTSGRQEVSYDVDESVDGVEQKVVDVEAPGKGVGTAQDVKPGSWRNLTEGEVSRMSELGRRMFIEESITDEVVTHPANHTTKYTILVWKHGKALENRYIHRYSSKTYDPFESCSVSNCAVSYDEDQHLATADAVLFHLHRTKGPESLPNATGLRPRHQRWVFMTDESPHHIFLYRNRLENYDGVFNWSMMYRLDADVPVPYGRALRLTLPQPPREYNVAGNKTKLAAILGSNCGGPNNRWKYVKMLQEHMQIDVYGKCGTIKCAGHYGSDCPALADYKFYFSFENSNCHDYITEKSWFNAYEHRAVAVVMGASRSDYAHSLPPHSYIHTEDYASPQQLAEYLLALDRDDRRYNEYFKWKNDYKILNEHGYFGTPVFHYCRLCQALNYNSREEKIYGKMKDYISLEKDCYKQSWTLPKGKKRRKK